MKNILPYSVNYEIAIFGKKINWKVQHNVRQHQSKTLEYLKIQESLRSENLTEYYYICKEQKQPSRDVLRKRCSENMQQIYRRTPMPKCDFNNLASIYMFKVNNRNTRNRCEICSKLTIKTLALNDAIGVVLASLLLILNIFDTLF